MPVSEHISNGFEGMALQKHSCCKAVAKGMRSLVRDINTCRLDMPPDDLGDRVVTAHGTVGSTAGQENFRISAVGASVVEVIEQTLASLHGQRQQGIFAMFGCLEQDLILSPVDILQSQCPQLSAPHTVGVQELKDWVVPSARISAALGTLKNLLCLRFGQSARQCCQLVGAQCGYSQIEGALNMALMETEPKEGPQCRLH